MEPCLTSMLSNLDKPLEPLTLSCVSCCSYETNQDNLDSMTGNKQSIILDPVQMNGLKTNTNHINPILPPSPNPINDEAIGTSKKHGCNHIKVCLVMEKLEQVVCVSWTLIKAV